MLKSWSHVRRYVRRHWVVSQKSSLSEPACWNRLSLATVCLVETVNSVETVGSMCSLKSFLFAESD